MAITESKGDGYALYNGVKLPGLPEVDWESYPYVTMIGVEDAFAIIIATAPMVHGDKYIETSADVFAMQYECEDGKWALYLDRTEAPAGSMVATPEILVWSNHNILNTDNTVFLSASSPIPLDGMNVIEWDGDTTGLETVEGGCKVSDIVLTVDQISNAVGAYCEYGVMYQGFLSELSGGVIDYDQMGFVVANICVCAYNTTTYPSTGLWFLYGSDDSGSFYSTLLAYTPASGGDGEATAETPTFTANLPAFAEYTYTQGDTADTLSVTAEVSDGGTITYQWFKDSVVVGTDSSYTPATDTVGSWTYFCRATNTLESGLVATADSNAVTVKVKYDLRSFLTGLIAMLVSTPVRVARKIVGYLYNGVLLPALPEWDKTVYPYSFMYQSIGDCWGLVVSKVKPYYDNTASSYHTVVAGDHLWGLGTTGNTGWSLSEKTATSYGNPVWANYDVLDNDGNLYLAASEPVPVYE